MNSTEIIPPVNKIQEQIKWLQINIFELTLTDPKNINLLKLS